MGDDIKSEGTIAMATEPTQTIRLSNSDLLVSIFMTLIQFFFFQFSFHVSLSTKPIYTIIIQTH